MALTPDTKDWTWVLERPCAECGFDPEDFPREEFADSLARCQSGWEAVLSRQNVGVRAQEDRWSDLEYGCHVRDVFRVIDERLALLLAQDNPEFPNWDQDETAVAERYNEQDPSTVSSELIVAGQQLAARVETVAPDQWSRVGTRSNGSRFTVETLVRYGMHDVLHHQWDVASG